MTKTIKASSKSKGNIVKARYINQPWKISLWIIIICWTINDLVLRIRGGQAIENKIWLALFLLGLFTASVVLVGSIYNRSTKKIVSQKFRLRSALQISIGTVLWGLILLGPQAIFQNASWISNLFTIFFLGPGINFLVVYFLINLEYRLLKLV
tara:strand:+ start:72 stop:530 length:459 start_codon:yes stop_codon:yes gene_type:complete